MAAYKRNSIVWFLGTTVAEVPDAKNEDEIAKYVKAIARRAYCLATWDRFGGSVSVRVLGWTPSARKAAREEAANFELKTRFL